MWLAWLTTRCITRTRITADGPRAASARRSRTPKVYAQASPVSHVDRLVRPLLVLHGTADVNVPYLHSVRLIDALLKNRKGDAGRVHDLPWRVPLLHARARAQDAWTRVDRFFAKYLKQASRPQS